MARLARVVVPGLPHHITQRGNRRQPTFFCEEDYQSYLELMAQWCSWHRAANELHLRALRELRDRVSEA
jgi:REP-associated tyrosine transposase